MSTTPAYKSANESAYTHAQLAALDAAIASGELTVKYDGREVTYRSIDQLLLAREFICTRLPGQSRRVGYSVAFVDRR